MEKKEAMKILKDFYDKSALFSIRTALDTVIPELKESKDEKIRKTLINFFDGWGDKVWDNGVRYSEVVAWLQKQGKHANFRNKIQIGDKVTRNDNGELVNLSQLERVAKQSEPVVRENKGNDGGISPNSAWSEEDEGIRNELIKYFTSLLECIATEERHIENRRWLNWLKSIKDKVGCEVNCTTIKVWSEEDEAHFDSILKRLEGMCKPGATFVTTRCPISTDKKWLKLLKERVQPQNIAYYNPYKEVVESIAEMCKHYDKASHSGLRDFYDNVKVKCKDAKEYDSLYPHNTWKPTENQIDALFAAVYLKALRNTLEKDSVKQLEELYNQLKKLKG